jgi:polyphosphate kinase
MQVPNGAASFDVEVTMTSDARAKDLDHRVRGELVDSFDEESEMEIDDDRLKKAIEEFSERPEQAGIDRALYFRELFRLQGELVKLQDWIVDQKLKVVVIFEGRDAAGKGGVIKRIT